MATDPDELIDDELPEDGEQEEELPEANDETTEEGEDETIIEIEGDDASDDPLVDAPDDTPLQKKLRAELRTRAAREREKDRRIQELEAVSAPKPVDVGKKPTLEDCEWDADKFEAALTAYHERVAANDRRTAEQANAQQALRDKEEREHITYKARASTLRVPDYQAAEDAVVAAFPQPFQAAILKLDNSAETVYALAKNPARITALTEMWAEDPVKALYALRDVSKGVKVTVTRKKPPEPETIARSSAPIALVSGDKQMERLEKEARRTGDRSKLIAHKADHERAARAK